MPPLAARPRGFMAVARSTPPSSSLRCRGLRRERHDAVLPGAGGARRPGRSGSRGPDNAAAGGGLASSVAPEAGWHEHRAGPVWRRRRRRGLEPARRVRSAGERRRGPLGSDKRVRLTCGSPPPGAAVVGHDRRGAALGSATFVELPEQGRAPSSASTAGGLERARRAPPPSGEGRDPARPPVGALTLTMCLVPSPSYPLPSARYSAIRYLPPPSAARPER